MNADPPIADKLRLANLKPKNGGFNVSEIYMAWINCGLNVSLVEKR